ncbi:MAG TPA: hypothetical protein VFS67_32745 [Polyangiaceae bacterium]|nr:hypothetical protein [Polyangiaceae bacterium]
MDTVKDDASTTLQLRLERLLSRVEPEDWFWVIASGIAGLYGLRSAWFFFHMNAPLHFDDGYVTSVGERLLDGHWLPYVDAASHRGPVMYWLAALAQAIGGRMEWYGVRALSSLAFLSSLAGVWASAFCRGRRFVAAFGALGFVFISLALLELQTVFGLVGEAIATPWLMMAFLATSLALRSRGELLSSERAPALRRRCALLAAAGVLSALSGLTKQTYLIVVGPLLLWTLSVALSEPADSRAQRWAPLAALAIGWVVPPVLVVLLYVAKGYWGTFYYWFYRYNVDVYMAPFQGVRVGKTLYHWARDYGYLSFAMVLLLSSVASQYAAPLLSSKTPLAKTYARYGFELTVLLQAVLSLAIGFSTLRFWPQYFLPPVPWFALLVGLGLEHSLGKSPYQARPANESWLPLLVTTIAVGGFAICMLEQCMYTLARARENGQFIDARPERLCADIDRLAPAGKPIYIWGFDAEYYVTCQRHAASRYVYSTLIAGQVPPDWSIHPEWSARNSVDTLLTELEAADPPLILDSPQRTHGVSMTQIEPLNAYLREHYCDTGVVRTNDGRRMNAWQRRDLCAKRN